MSAADRRRPAGLVRSQRSPTKAIRLKHAVTANGGHRMMAESGVSGLNQANPSASRLMMDGEKTKGNSGGERPSGLPVQVWASTLGMRR